MVTQKQILSKLNRKERGHLLTQNKDIQRTTDGFKVPSQTQENKEYTFKTGKEWSCTCHDYQKEDVDSRTNTNTTSTKTRQRKTQKTS